MGTRSGRRQTSTTAEASPASAESQSEKCRVERRVLHFPSLCEGAEKRKEAETTRFVRTQFDLGFNISICGPSPKAKQESR